MMLLTMIYWRRSVPGLKWNPRMITKYTKSHKVSHLKFGIYKKILIETHLVSCYA